MKVFWISGWVEDRKEDLPVTDQELLLLETWLGDVIGSLARIDRPANDNHKAANDNDPPKEDDD